jgi:membrane-bound metal-dependent hydrolase YbcI (DUF457 family)
MPLAVTHVIITFLVISLFRDHVLDKKHRKHVTLFAIFLGGVAGLLPDADILIGQFFNISIHGGILHTLFFGLLFLIPAWIFHKKKNEKLFIYFLLISLGVFIHIFLDFILGGGDLTKGIMFFWPLMSNGYVLHDAMTYSNTFIVQMDAMILLIWLGYEQRNHNIKKFI